MDRDTLNLRVNDQGAGADRWRRTKSLIAAAWLVHLYTASGAIAGLIALDYTAHNDYQAAFAAMAVAIAIDSSDGPLARALEVRRRIPIFDGALLDNIVDYLNYVAAPAFLMIQAGILPRGDGGLEIGAFMMIASAYGFCRIDAKTEDHYFRGFPSYWNLAAFYLYYVELPSVANVLIIAVLSVMVFLPTRYIYPNRTVPMRRITLSLAGIWAIATLIMLIELPARPVLPLCISLAFIVYYFVMSFALNLRNPAAMNSRSKGLGE